MNFRFFRRKAASAWLPILALGVALWLNPAACTDNDLTAENGGADSTGEASLKLRNFKEQDPGPIVVSLYDSNAVDAQSAIPVKTLGTVDEADSAVFKVPAGRWKLAYDDGSRLWPMTDADSSELIWPKAEFKQDSAYTATIFTEDTRNLWSYDIPAVP